MKKSTTFFAVMSALLGGILIGFLLSPMKHGVNFHDNKISIGNHNGNGNKPKFLYRKM